MKILKSQFRILVIVQLIWLAIVCLVGAWWGWLVIQQARRISELEAAVGGISVTPMKWLHTQRMVYWESFTFFGLLLTSSGVLFWFYWRDMKRSKGLQAFFASVTHELRTPLTSIRLQGESISNNLTGDSSQRHLIKRLIEDTLRLEAQVERTLELARIEGGGPVYTQAVQIKPWLERFLKNFRENYFDQLEVRSSLEDVLIEADPNALQVIFKNLLENSIKHSRKDKVAVTVECRTWSEGVEIWVKDSGSGSSAMNQKALGQIFQKGPQSHGTGVGLYLVKVLMKKMQGWANFNSGPGFEVQLFFRAGKC